VESPVGSLRHRLDVRDISAVELADEVIVALGAVAEQFGAIAALDPERARADALASDRRRAAGTVGAFEGIPITVKDWIDVADWPVAGSVAAHRDRRPEHDATTVARLRAAGAVVVGITTALADSPAHGRTSNARDATRAPGGSSSGAAVVVAAGAAPLALGSDSGGSIRLPAAWCGTSGLKPTFGRVPLTGHFPRLGELSDARTVIGPLANDARDLATALSCIAGPDGLDAGVVPVPLVAPAAVDISQLRIGTVAGGVPDHVAHAVDQLRAAGATSAADAIPDVRDEALDISRRYWTRAQLSGADNATLLWDWDRFRRRMLVATRDLDALVMPSVTEPAPPWRESIETDYVWQLPWSLTGAPAVVVPAGSEAGLPLSVQVVGRRFEDHVPLTLAAVLGA
jgi:amidase